MLLISAMARSIRENNDAGGMPASGNSILSWSLVLAVDIPDRLLHQTLDHRVQRHPALLRLGNTKRARRSRTDLHFFVGVPRAALLGRPGIDSLIAQAEDPAAGPLIGVHRADGSPAVRARLCATA